MDGRQRNRLEINLSRGILVSDEDRDLLVKSKWAISKGYALGNAKLFKGQASMHRIIMQRVLGRKLIKGEHVDHINGIGIDNRRDNLRLATRSQNLGNQRINRNNSTGFKGVSYHKQRGKWVALICVNGTRHYLGIFNTPEGAKFAYDKAAVKYFGEFARLK